MRSVFSTVLLSALMMASVMSAAGWDDVGHKLTGFIAWQRMTPQTREAVIKILRAAPEDSQLSTFYASYGAQPEETRKREFFMLVPTWADIVRDRAFATRYRKYHHSNWHYDDTFWKQVNGKAEILSGFEEGGQAVPQLVAAEKTLRDPKASDADKAIAIAWLLHLTGDIHQPLHTSARVTDREPKGDQGGNLFLLTPEGTPRETQVNLHWFWDSITGRSVPIKGEQCDRDYIEPIARMIIKKYPFEKMKGKLNLSQYGDWQKESFAYAPTVVFSPDLVRFKMPSEKYRKAAFQLAEQQFAMAGYRIGETLNSIFTTPPAPVAAN